MDKEIFRNFSSNYTKSTGFVQKIWTLSKKSSKGKLQRKRLQEKTKEKVTPRKKNELEENLFSLNKPKKEFASFTYKTFLL